MAAAEPEGALKELESLAAYNVVYKEDKAQAFIQWAREHAERLYPNLGEKGYVVPPLFIHKHSTRYDDVAGAEVLKDYQKSSPKGEKAHIYVARSFSLLSPKLDRPLFIISGLEYDNMLKWVRHHPHLSPALPDAVENRGDIDIMLIHPEHGVVFIQVKAVGDNDQSRTAPEIWKRIKQAGRQLKKDANILQWVMQDWDQQEGEGAVRGCRVTQVLALPNLTRCELAQFWPPSPPLDPASEDAAHLEGVVFLCKDQLPTEEDPSTPEADLDVGPLLAWWSEHVARVRCELSLPFMKDMVSRYVGMLSAVEVYAGNNIRKEVRLSSDAIDVCGMMFRRILLNEQQLGILCMPCQRRYLSGPPGSGKTVLLVLRGRQFIRQGGHVVVINMYRGAAGRAIGHYIRDSIARYRRPQSHDSKKPKAKHKPRKKKADESPTAGTPPAAKQKTEPSPMDTPTAAGTGSDISPLFSSPSAAGREHDTHTSLLGTPPSRKKRHNTPPTARHQGSPPVARKRGTPPTARKLQATPSVEVKGKGQTTPPSARKTQTTPPGKGQGTPPTPRKTQGPTSVSKSHQDTFIDMSDRVHSIDVDLDTTAFDCQAFERDIRRCLPSDVDAQNVLFIVDEIYVQDYWSGVLDVLNAGFDGCHIWCAGLYSRNPPSFQQEDLMQVVRCPPLVQKVLYAVDWDKNRRECYQLNTEGCGIYTPGMRPLSIRHQDHPQVTITECRLCARLLSCLLLQELGLTVSAQPGSAQLTCSDVVILVNIPRALYEPDARGFLDTTKQDFSNYMGYLSRCPLVTALRDYGVPINVVEELPCWDLYNLPGGQVAMAWAYSYQGLENKVVVYLPGDTPWTSDVYDREIPAPGLCLSPRETPLLWRPVIPVDAGAGDSCRDVGQAGGGQAIPDCHRPPTGGHSLQSASISCAPGADPLPRPQPQSDVPSAETPVTRGLDKHAQLEADAQGLPGTDAGGRGGPGSWEGPRTGERVDAAGLRWQTADVERYSNWDKTNVFVAASRCLSQLIMLVP